MKTARITVPIDSSPPGVTPGVIGWLRTNLFSTWYNTLLTVLLTGLIGLALGPLFHWVFRTATWDAVAVNLRLFTVGLYPAEHLWRPGGLLILIAFLFGGSAAHGRGMIRGVCIVLLLLFILLTLLPTGRARPLTGGGLLALVAGFRLGRTLSPGSALWSVGWILSLPIALLVLRGVQSSVLPYVPTTQWGGLMLTLLLAFVGIAASFPLGLVLALGRQSALPLIRIMSIAYIELIRGVPLVSVLMMFALLLPLFLPANFTRPDMLLRVMVGLTLFTAAYVAENIRGGLQAIPRGQYEAATALGLSWLQSMRYIILPQALRAVIPALVGQFISLFKDTSLATIVGLLELLGIAKNVIEQPQWKTIPGGVVFEVFGFTALVYFVFNYSMSLASRRLERALGVGQR
jgi:general L-amino acid transport system permease protein